MILKEKEKKNEGAENTEKIKVEDNEEEKLGENRNGSEKNGAVVTQKKKGAGLKSRKK